MKKLIIISMLLFALAIAGVAAGSLIFIIEDDEAEKVVATGEVTWQGANTTWQGGNVTW